MKPDLIPQLHVLKPKALLSVMVTVMVATMVIEYGYCGQSLR